LNISLDSTKSVSKEKILARKIVLPDMRDQTKDIEEILDQAKDYYKIMSNNQHHMYHVSIHGIRYADNANTLFIFFP